MFKKLKDKLAEEVKSSPQRIQQFAQAAQAAVTSASSSISDITNNDLFSIADNEGAHRSPVSAANQQSTFQDISLAQRESLRTGSDTQDNSFIHEENPRQRRLSNSSFASDISFRLPTYESPSMYHLQSDMDVSASEAEEKGFSGGTVNLDRVTKEQLFFAYRRTQDRCTKYKSQYADLARHYKLLERENAKARNVLVETQDKALRRISELREQCTLEQSAKAHLEKALRVEIEERNMKIDTLNMKLKFLDGNKENDKIILDSTNQEPKENDNNSQLIDLSLDDKQEIPKQESLQPDITALNNKVAKMEQLLNKYKESLKISKDKNAQVTAELQMLSTDLENKIKENEFLKSTNTNLIDAKQEVDRLNNVIEEMQNSYTTLEFSKNKEISVLKLDFEQAQEEISQLNSKIEGLSKREEEYAISLAENKLSIHKELETKEAEIKSLKDSLSVSQNEIQSLNIVVGDYKKNVVLLEGERSKLNNSISELNIARSKIKELEIQLDDLTKKCQIIENSKVKLDEESKCLELQLKQETAEKLAMIDRNIYLENRNTQLSEDCLKKSSQINNLESELKQLTNYKDTQIDSSFENNKLLDEVDKWKTKYIQLESEIQEEREELVKLQTEIEKLLCNHESIQNENIKLHAEFSELEIKNEHLEVQHERIKSVLRMFFNKVKTLQKDVCVIKEEINSFLEEVRNEIKGTLKENLSTIICTIYKQVDERNTSLKAQLKDVSDLCETNTVELYSKIKQYEELQTEQQQLKTEYGALKKTLDNNLEEHTASLTNMMTLNNEKQNLCDSLKVEINIKKDLTEKIEKMDKENATLKLKIKEFEENYIILKKGKDELLCELKLNEESKLSIERENWSLKGMIEEHKQDITNMEKKNEYLLEINKQSEDKINELSVKSEKLKQKIDEGELQTAQFKIENEKLLNEFKLLENENSEIQTKYRTLLEQVKNTEENNSKIGNDQNILIEKITSLQDAITSLETDNQILRDEIFELKTNNSTLTSENNNLHSKLKEIIEQNSAIDSENITNLKELNIIKDSNVYLQEKINIIKKQHEDDLISLEDLKSENFDLKKKAEDNNVYRLQSEELEKNIKVLKSENMVLKNQCEVISNNVKELEIEMYQVRNSHIEIEKEKDHLNSIIINLENESKPQDTLNNVYTQTNDIADGEKLVSSQGFTDKCVSTNFEQQNETTTNLDSSSLQLEHATLKEENRRLRSDIEGLQTYLAKISKENSHLNDKLREVITSNDNFTERSEITQYDTQALKNEIQSGKDKIDNLTRENMLLVEENLELKDQILFQSFNKSVQLNEQMGDEKQLNDINKKYNNVLESKNSLEKRVKELEYVNLSINDNMQGLQDNNEKLRLSNDKLGRRLDEALVSLRHLHSLQENTELEYLRNILFEYLTGTGAHSLTLAKVLSAVVKFNDSQTELVMQKERERQGILRQLGII